jgi:4-hydroxy-tetrahydrodipicolinate synthase
MGTSGEFAAFDEDERAAAVETVVQTAAGRVPVVANVSDASTRVALRHARRALAVGADAIAATPPYYYPHSQDELLAHYRTIRQCVDLPLYMYNIPQTVRVKVELATAQTLAAEWTVAGIKDSQNDLEWLRQLILFTRERELDFVAFAGTRYLIDAAVLIGASGAIPNIANAFPELCVTVYEAIRRGDPEAASRAESRIIRLEREATAIASGSRNAAVLGFLKALLWRRGVIASPRLTGPLRTPSADEQQHWFHRVEQVAETALAAHSANP